MPKRRTPEHDEPLEPLPPVGAAVTNLVRVIAEERGERPLPVLLDGPIGPGPHGHLLPRILERIRVGIPKGAAAEMLGVRRQRLNEWERGSDLIADALAAAEAEAEGVYVCYIAQAAARGQWQAAAWMLERTRPEKYGRLVMEHHGQGGGPVEVEVRLSFDGAPTE